MIFEEESGSIKDLVYKNCLKPLFPHHTNWSCQNMFKPGEEWCSIAELFASTKVQDELLKSSLDVVFVAYDIKDGIRQGEYVYLRVDDEFVEKVHEFEELARKFIGPKAHIFTGFDGPFIKQFDEGNYVRWHTMDSGCPIFNGGTYNFPRRLEEFRAYLTLDSERYYNLDRYVGWMFSKDFDFYYADKRAPFAQFLNDWFKSHGTFETIKDLCIIAGEAYQMAISGERKAKEDAEEAKKAAEEAKIQSYYDWVDEGNPTYYRFGFSYKGAKARPLSTEEALVKLDDKDYFEIKWETINGEKAMVIQQYSDNDMY